MSIRNNHYLIGETVEIGGSFTDASGQSMAATGVSLIIKKPDDSITTLPLTPIDGAFAVDVEANMGGTWHVRLECTGPTKSAKESKFIVVPSAVLPA